MGYGIRNIVIVIVIETCVVSSAGLRPKRKRAIICDASIYILHHKSLFGIPTRIARNRLDGLKSRRTRWQRLYV